ncbi:MAG: hypothetical protein ACK4RX_06165 [Chitinophagaceae bacterium]
MKKLLHVVPGFGNTNNAIFDYALILRECFKTKSLDTILQCKSFPDAYIISYVNAGYSLSEHLNNIFRLIRYRKRNIKGLVFFHEAFAARGRFYQKSFWYSPVERFIFKAYVRNASAIFCSCDPILKHIQDCLTKEVPLQIAPIPSNIFFGAIQEWSGRKSILVVFGTQGRRAAALNRKPELAKLLTHLGITEVWDIGVGETDYTWLPTSIQLKRTGYLTRVEIAKIIASAKYGLIDYPGYLLDKSGIFAAYAAAGLCVINTDESFLLAKRLYFTLSEMLDSADMGIEIRVKDLNSYYTKERSAEAHAEKLLAVLTK